MKMFTKLWFAAAIAAVMLVAGCSNAAGGGNGGGGTPDPFAGHITASVGDIIFSDGTTCTKDNYAEACAGKTPVAIVFNTENGRTLGVGLKDGGQLAWIGSSVYHKDNELGTTNADGYANCQIIYNRSDYSAENYPAFNFAKTYGEQNGFTGSLSGGWYIPAYDELDDLSDAKIALYASIEKINEITANTADAFATTGDPSYWSSTEYPYSNNNYFNNAYKKKWTSTPFTYGYKDNPEYVRVIRKF